MPRPLPSSLPIWLLYAEHFVRATRGVSRLLEAASRDLLFPEPGWPFAPLRKYWWPQRTLPSRGRMDARYSDRVDRVSARVDDRRRLALQSPVALSTVRREYVGT